MPHTLVVLFFLIFSNIAFSAKAHQSLPSPIPENLPVIDLEVELYTVGLGPEVYMRYGHTLLGFHFKSTGQRFIYNWGMFDFSDPLFPVNFYLGQRTYWVGDVDYSGMIRLYKNFEDRNVFRDILNLTEVQKSKLVTETNRMLTQDKMFFRYEHFERNCSTIPRDLIDLAVGGAISKTLSKEPAEHNFRWYVRTHMGIIPYLGWLLDIAMNSKLDVPQSKWEESFYPIKLRQYLLESPSIDDSGNSIPSSQFMQFDKQLVNASSDWFNPDPNFYIYVSLILLVFIVLSIYMQNFISQLISSVIIGTVFGVVGLSMLVSWALSSHFDMHHNFNMLVFFPTDLILAFTVKLREKLWMRRYALIHFLAFMLYVVIGYSGLVDQNIHRAAPVGFLYVLWILVYTRLVKIQNNKLSLNLT
jgi:hypothetical protein